MYILANATYLKKLERLTIWNDRSRGKRRREEVVDLNKEAVYLLVQGPLLHEHDR